MKDEIKVTKCKVRGVSMWRVRWYDAGRVHRKFFGGRDAADSHASGLRGEAVSARKRLAALSQVEQEQLLALHAEAKRRNIPLLALLDTPVITTTSPKISEVLTEMEQAKEKAGRADDYLKGLRQTVESFYDGRETMAIDLFGLKDVEVFLDSKNIASRSTHRSRLSTLFEFAIRRGYQKDNPCDRLEPITTAKSSPRIFTVADTKKCLEWLKGRPRSMAWFVLSTFCGLRPEEAEKTTWKDIHFDEGWVRVEAQTTKVRQRRVVYPLPTAMEWLKYAKRKRAQLPMTRKQRTIERKALRAFLKWKAWPKDITRHTAASNWIAHHGSVADVATALGNSEKVLRRDYMALVTKAEAEKFWALRPNL